jgi:hypothetical protein
MHSPQSSVYSETLARCTHVVYPSRFLRTAAHRWASVFIWLWLGHMYMESKDLPMHSPPARCTVKPYPIAPAWSTT